MNNKIFTKDISIIKIDEMEGQKQGFIDREKQIIYLSPACFSLFQTDYELIRDKLSLVEVKNVSEENFVEWYNEYKKIPIK